MEAPVERGHLWSRNFRFTLAVLERQREGLTDAAAAIRPAPGCAAPAWLVGHLVATRYLLLGLLGQPLPAGTEWKTHYSRGAEGASAHLPFSELCDTFKATDAALVAAFRAVEDWDRPTPNPGLGSDQPLEQVVAFLYWHESHHLGQIAWARRLLGLPGAL